MEIIKKKFDYEKDSHFQKLKYWYGEYLTNYEVLFKNSYITIYLVRNEPNKFTDEDSIELIRIFNLGQDVELSVDKQLPFSFENMVEMFKIANEKVAKI